MTTAQISVYDIRNQAYKALAAARLEAGNFVACQTSEKVMEAKKALEVAQAAVDVFQKAQDDADDEADNASDQPLTAGVPDDDFDYGDDGVGGYLGDGRNEFGCFCTKTYMCGECQQLEEAVDAAQQRLIDKCNQD